MSRKRSNRFPLAILIVIIIFVIYFSSRGGLPEAPEGYSWKQSDRMNSHFLVPEGWSYKEEAEEGSDTIYITKAPVGEDGGFSVGLFVNALNDCADTMGMSPSEYAERFIDDMSSIAELKGRSEPVGAGGDFLGYGAFFTSEEEGEDGGRTVQFVLTLGNDKTGTMYVAIFKSPEREWEGAWAAGRKIIDNLAFDNKH
ncbi:hypothetical protein ACFL42_04675 [Candidatus Omnitrophota bacterium]